MGNNRPKVLMLRIEPAGYMIALGKALRATWPGEIDVIFVSRALTQSWDFDQNCFKHEILPKGRMNAIRTICHRIHDTRPDLLHVAGWSALPSLAAILAGRVYSLPVVVDLDTWRGTASKWRNAVKRLIYPWLFHQVTHFAPGGRRQAAYISNFGVPEQKITPVGMTVDVAAIRHFIANKPDAGAMFRKRFGIESNAIMALYLGRLVSLKGLDDLIAAWPQVASQVTGSQLVIAGDGELSERIAEAAQLDTSIRPIGRLSGDDVWSAYAAADFVVAPSHFENWGLVVNESMAVGKPIIITDVFGCVGDLARHDETSLVVPARDPQHLANTMTRLALDANTRRRLASTASNEISGWKIENEARMISSIWEHALDGSTSHRSPRSAGETKWHYII